MQAGFFFIQRIFSVYEQQSNARLTHTRSFLTNIKHFFFGGLIALVVGIMDLPMDHQTLEWCCQRSITALTSPAVFGQHRRNCERRLIFIKIYKNPKKNEMHATVCECI